MERIPLTAAEIHLWLVFYDEITDAHLCSAYRELLSAEEKNQEPQFVFATDQRRYLVTRALVRTVLSRYVSIQPQDWVFSTNPYGRPEVANGGARDAGLSFNIAHTHSLIVLGVTRNRAIGVDVENLHAREVSLDIAKRFFAAEEVALLNATPPHQQQDRFFEFWTFKEAYIKARGMGLSLPLDKFSFCYPGDHAVRLAIDSELGDNSTRWRFWQFRPTPPYLVAVCAEHNGARPARLIVRKAIPTLNEEICAPEFLRV